MATDPRTEANIQLLQDEIRAKGFPENILPNMAEQIREKKAKDLYIPFSSQVDERSVKGGLYFLKDLPNSLYEWHSFNLDLGKDSDALIRKNLFLAGNDNDISLREAYNLMHGREVYKLYPDGNRKEGRWLSLDLKERMPNYLALNYARSNDFIEDVIATSLLRNFLGSKEIDELGASLKQGNRQEIRLDVGGLPKKLFVTALPRLARLAIRDKNGKVYDFMDISQLRQLTTPGMERPKGKSR